MKNFSSLIFALIFAINPVFSQLDSSIFHQINDLLIETQKKYTPDKRIAILEYGNKNIATNSYLIQSTEKEAILNLQNKLKTIKADISYQLLPDTTIQGKPYGIIQLSVANMRTQPGHAAEMATQSLLGTQVDILQKSKGEYRVRTPEGYISWIPTSSLTAMTHQELNSWKSSAKMIYTAEFGKSFSQPDLSSIRVSDLVYGNILAISKVNKNFYEVQYPDGRTAFVPKNEATTLESWLQSRVLSSENILQSAKTMMGLPYLWGGTSVKGVDCSGFTKTAFFMNGYIIPRDASQQVLAGDNIDILDQEGHFDAKKALRNLQPADLLFFAAGKNQAAQPRVTHVALYLGNGEFIHAAGTVRINSMLKDAANYDDFQTRTVVAAKRYISTKTTPQIQKIQDNIYYSK